MEDEMRDDVAYWITLDECANEGVYCSECHKKVFKLDYSNTMKIRSKFCPNCGRRMVETGFDRLESDVKALLIVNEHNKFLSCFYYYKLASVTAIKNNKEGNILLIKYYKVNEKDNFTIRITFDDHRSDVRSAVMFSGKDVIVGLNVNLMRYICDVTDDVIKHCITKN